MALDYLSWIPSQWLFVIFAAVVALGAAMLLYGRVLARPFMVLIGAGVGLAVAGPVASRLGFNLLAIQIALPIILAAAGMLLGPVAWAVVMGVVFAGAGASLTIWRYWPEVFDRFYSAVVAFVGKGDIDLLREFKQALGSIWRGHSQEIMIVVAVSMAALIMIGLLKPVITTIFMNSLVGAFGVLAGVLLILVSADSTMSQKVDQHWQVMLALMLTLMMFGIVYQFCGDVRATSRRAQKQDKQEPEDAQPQMSANVE